MELQELIDIKKPGNMALCEPTNTVSEAAKLMRDHQCGDVIVVTDRNAQSTVKGIVTDRDIALRCVAEGKTLKKPRSMT